MVWFIFNKEKEKLDFQLKELENILSSLYKKEIKWWEFTKNLERVSEDEKHINNVIYESFVKEHKDFLKLLSEINNDLKNLKIIRKKIVELNDKKLELSNFVREFNYLIELMEKQQQLFVNFLNQKSTNEEFQKILNFEKTGDISKLSETLKKLLSMLNKDIEVLLKELEEEDEGLDLIKKIEGRINAQDYVNVNNNLNEIINLINEIKKTKNYLLTTQNKESILIVTLKYFKIDEGFLIRFVEKYKDIVKINTEDLLKFCRNKKYYALIEKIIKIYPEFIKENDQSNYKLILDFCDLIISNTDNNKNLKDIEKLLLNVIKLNPKSILIEKNYSNPSIFLLVKKRVDLLIKISKIFPQILEIKNKKNESIISFLIFYYKDNEKLYDLIYEFVKINPKILFVDSINTLSVFSETDLPINILLDEYYKVLNNSERERKLDKIKKIINLSPDIIWKDKIYNNYKTFRNPLDIAFKNRDLNFLMWLIEKTEYVDAKDFLKNLTEFLNFGFYDIEKEKLFNILDLLLDKFPNIAEEKNSEDLFLIQIILSNINIKTYNYKTIIKIIEKNPDALKEGWNIGYPIFIAFKKNCEGENRLEDIKATCEVIKKMIELVPAVALYRNIQHKNIAELLLKDFTGFLYDDSVDMTKELEDKLYKERINLIEKIIENLIEKIIEKNPEALISRYSDLPSAYDLLVNWKYDNLVKKIKNKIKNKND